MDTTGRDWLQLGSLLCGVALRLLYQAEEIFGDKMFITESCS